MQEEIIFTEQEVAEAIPNMARKIVLDYKKYVTYDKKNQVQSVRLVLVGVLRGAIYFVSDLSRAINDVPENQIPGSDQKYVEVEMDFITIRTQDGQESGELNCIMDIITDIRGRHVLVCDECCEKEKTLKYVDDQFKKKEPTSLDYAVLVDKADSERVEGAPSVKYVGLVYHGKAYLGGQGMDDREIKRNRKYIFSIPKTEEVKAA
jgi:hypoxanthine phosphoribosyltransferase